MNSRPHACYAGTLLLNYTPSPMKLNIYETQKKAEKILSMCVYFTLADLSLFISFKPIIPDI
jgi:hypothetical protein